MKTKILLSYVLAVVFALNISADNYYVKTTGSASNSGTSWSDALTLDAAMSVAKQASNDVIHIAAGTYTPTELIVTETTTTDRDKTFEVSKNITIIGGYPEEATAESLPDPVLNATVLSGDLGGTKVYHTLVITAPPVAGQKVTISGITIKNGLADGAVNVTTTHNNFAMPRGTAAGVCVIKSTVEFTDCNIIDNVGNMGTALTTLSYANVTLNRCNIFNNTTNGNGTVYVNSPYATMPETALPTLTLNETNIYNNSISGTGAGLYTYQYCNVYVINSAIYNNSAPTSGHAGMYLREGAQGYMVNSTVHGNTASGRGGVFLYSTAGKTTSFDIISSTITANKGANTGGLELSANGSTSNIYNTIISGNADASKEFKPQSGSTHTILNSIASDKVFDNTGSVIAEEVFEKDNIKELANNGGKTMSCMIEKNGNPAITGGMTSAQLTVVGAALNPSVAAAIIAKDQLGNDRTTTIMGAIVDSIGTGVRDIKQGRDYPIFVVGNTLHINDSEGQNVSVYSVLGQQLKSVLSNSNNLIINDLQSQNVYIVKIGKDSFKIKM